MSQASEDIVLQSWENLQTFVLGGGKFQPRSQGSKFRDLDISVSFQQITFKRGSFTNFRALFAVVSTDFP